MSLAGSESPARTLIVAFLCAILVGTIFLSLPTSTASGDVPPWHVALFTATSAVCVTGLVVVTTADYWSGFGQAVILGLIIVGGLGVMTTASVIYLLMGHRVQLTRRRVIGTAWGGIPVGQVSSLLRRAFVFTLLVEGIGALGLFIMWYGRFPLPEAAWHAVFQSASAFNNAGFDTFGDSLEGFQHDPATQLWMMVLIMVGGLGYPVITELFERRQQIWRLWSLHTRVVLIVNAVLWTAAAVGYFVLERAGGTLVEMPVGMGVTAAAFHAVTPRTAGFNVLPTGEMTAAALVFTMLLMFIGGSPASTAGGIKTTTIAVLAAHFVQAFRGIADAELLKRKVPESVVRTAVIVAGTGLFWIGMLSFALTVTEAAAGPDFLDLAFESVSALGTVGLSTGLTPDLSVPGRLLVILSMFVGRVGPVTVMYALLAGEPRRLRRPSGEIIIG